MSRMQAAALLAGALALGAAGASWAQALNYSEAISAYKDDGNAGIKLQDSVTPGVAAKSRVSRALTRNKVVDSRALVQPDGTLALPSNQTNLVIRTNYNDVQQTPDGQVRIGSPTIAGDVNGNVTLFVDGDGVKNITVLNSGR